MSYRLQDGIEFLKSLPDHSVDGLFTDPPWLMKAAYHDGKYDRARGVRLQGAENWTTLIKEMTDEGLRILKPDIGRCFIWLGTTSVGPAIKAVSALEYRFMFFCYFIPPRYVAGFQMSHDPILYFAPPGAQWPTAHKGRKPIRSIYQFCSTGQSDTLHPCARPFRAVRDMLNDLFLPGEYVIDPFAGSDTTGVACRELNLKYDSCEIDPMMYETGLARHSQQGLFE